MQTRKERDRIIAEAERKGYGGYYWFVRVKYRLQEYAGSYPNQWIPVIPLGPDPEKTKWEAWFLQEVFRITVDIPQYELATELTHISRLEELGLQYYEFGEYLPLDAICYVCGAIGQAHYTVANESWMCADCAAEVNGI